MINLDFLDVGFLLDVIPFDHEIVIESFYVCKLNLPIQT